jgi:hypothetical protein
MNERKWDRSLLGFVDCGAALPAAVPRSNLELVLDSSLPFNLITLLWSPYPFRLITVVPPCTSPCEIFEIALFYPTDWINSSTATQIMDPGLGTDEVLYTSILPQKG